MRDIPTIQADLDLAQTNVAALKRELFAAQSQAVGVKVGDTVQTPTGPVRVTRIEFGQVQPKSAQPNG